jgi:hypothetical protein
VSDDGAPEPEPEASEQNPLRRTLELFVFAPVGMALTVLDDLPGLIDKGRQRVENEISNARIVGKFVVDQGQREVTTRLGDLLGHGNADTASEADPTAPSPPTPATGDHLDEAGASASAATPPSGPPEQPAPPAFRPPPDPADAAIVEGALAGYDTLSASQVVRRLESLDPEELLAVHRHEASHRSRRTILNRTSQLLADGDDAPASAAE